MADVTCVEGLIEDIGLGKGSAILFFEPTDFTQGQIDKLEARFPGILKTHIGLNSNEQFKTGNISLVPFPNGQIIFMNARGEVSHQPTYLGVRMCLEKLRDHLKELDIHEVHTVFPGTQYNNVPTMQLVFEIALRNEEMRVVIYR